MNYDEPLATEMELRRDRKRLNWRLTYDCFNALSKDGLVYCQKGYTLGRTQKPTLKAVLEGLACQACKFCHDFDTEKEGDDVRDKG